MVMPNSEERTGEKVSFTLLVFLPRESTGHVGLKENHWDPTKQEKGSHSKYIPEGRQGKAGLQFPKLNNFRGTGIQEHLWLSRIKGYSDLECEGSVREVVWGCEVHSCPKEKWPASKLASTLH